MKKMRPASSRKNQPVRRATSALTPEQMDMLAAQLFCGDGRQEGRTSEHWPETEVRMLAGAPANRRAL
jgi:hypothetical protein